MNDFNHALTTPIDALAFAPHPDDAELYCAGTLLMLKRAGFTVGIVDMTRGELSSRGTMENRTREADSASSVLGLDLRLNLGLPDGDIQDTPEHRLPVIKVVRRCKPRLALIPYPHDRHPDHEATSVLCRHAFFFSGITKIQVPTNPNTPELLPHRPTRVLYYMMTRDFAPDILVDISPVIETKRQAIAAYGTQFFNQAVEAEREPQTYISTPEFMNGLDGRSARLGFLAGGRYAEGFALVDPLIMKPEWLVK